MRRLGVFLAVIGLTGFLMGTATPAQARSSAPVQGTRVVATVGTFQGHTSFFQPATPDRTGRSTFDGRCSVPSNWIIGFTGSGTLKPLGAFTLTGTHCTQFDQATGKGTFTDGWFTYLLASGDQFSGPHAGVFRIVDNVSYFSDAFVLISGTGHFAHSTGGFLEKGTQDLGTDVLQANLTGAVTIRGAGH